MPRSGEDARRRLQQAALELYREHGYDQTTTAEIAARAGVTERTFFRHFPDKREVLFGGDTLLSEGLARAVIDAPATLDPLGALLHAFRIAAPLMEGYRSFSEPRSRIIAATPALRERELAKTALLTAALGAALRQRGVAGRQADLAAAVGMAAFGDAFTAWLDDPGPGLLDDLDRAFADLRALTGRPGRAPRPRS